MLDINVSRSHVRNTIARGKDALAQKMDYLAMVRDGRKLMEIADLGLLDDRRNCGLLVST